MSHFSDRSQRVRSVVWFVTGAVLATSVMLMFANAWSVDAAPGDADSTFVPVTPCRLADTRPEPNRVGPAGTLSGNDTTTFQAHGTNGECAISSDAVGLSLNVTALGATSAGDFLTFWPDGERPLAASLNPAPGEPPTPNAVTTPLSAAGSFNVYNFAGTTDVVIDVVGYYTKASLQELASRLAAVEASAATNTTGVATNAAGIAGLDAAQPFAETNRSDSDVVIVAEGTVVSVSVVAPVAGQVTVNSTLTVFDGTAGDRVACSLTTGTTHDADYFQGWESSGANGRLAQLAGTRTFNLAAGATGTYNLVCSHLGTSGDSFLNDSVLTAIFTPAP